MKKILRKRLDWSRNRLNASAMLRDVDKKTVCKNRQETVTKWRTNNLSPIYTNGSTWMIWGATSHRNPPQLYVYLSRATQRSATSPCADARSLDGTSHFPRRSGTFTEDYYGKYFNAISDVVGHDSPCQRVASTVYGNWSLGPSARQSSANVQPD